MDLPRYGRRHKSKNVSITFLAESFVNRYGHRQKNLSYPITGDVGNFMRFAFHCAFLAVFCWCRKTTADNIYIRPIRALFALCVGTIYLTVLVTVNRYVAVCRPYKASDTNAVRKQARQHVALVATFSVLFNVTRFFEYEIEDSGLRATPTWLTMNFLYKV